MLRSVIKQSICPKPLSPKIFFNYVHLNKLKSAHNRRACNKQMMMLDVEYDYSPWPCLLAPFFFAGLPLPIEDIVHDRDHQRQRRNKWSEATCSPSCLQFQILRLIARAVPPVSVLSDSQERTHGNKELETGNIAHTFYLLNLKACISLPHSSTSAPHDVRLFNDNSLLSLSLEAISSFLFDIIFKYGILHVLYILFIQPKETDEIQKYTLTLVNCLVYERMRDS